MSGYLGDPDYAAMHAMILNENAAHAIRQLLPTGESAHHCNDCDTVIPEARRVAMKGCRYCIECQSAHDHGPVRTKMFTKML